MFHQPSSLLNGASLLARLLCRTTPLTDRAVHPPLSITLERGLGGCGALALYSIIHLSPSSDPFHPRRVLSSSSRTFPMCNQQESRASHPGPPHSSPSVNHALSPPPMRPNSSVQPGTLPLRIQRFPPPPSCS